jgi:hypothetical protein
VTVRSRSAGRLKEDASIMDNSVHSADAVHLIGEFPGFGRTAEVADDDSCRGWGEVTKRRRPLEATGMEDNVMAFTHENTGGGPTEPVGGAGDEDARHGLIVRRVIADMVDEHRRAESPWA